MSTRTWHVVRGQSKENDEKKGTDATVPFNSSTEWREIFVTENQDSPKASGVVRVLTISKF
jgi:hypothetical protein